MAFGDRTDFDLAEASPSGHRIHHNAWSGHQGQVSADSQVDIDMQSVLGNYRLVKSSFTSPAVSPIFVRRGTTERPVRVTSPKRWSIRIRSWLAAGSCSGAGQRSRQLARCGCGRTAQPPGARPAGPR